MRTLLSEVRMPGRADSHFGLRRQNLRGAVERSTFYVRCLPLRQLSSLRGLERLAHGWTIEGQTTGIGFTFPIRISTCRNFSTIFSGSY